MSALQERSVAVQGRQVRVLSAGPARERAVLLLQGGMAGVAPYCGGPHMWAPDLERWLAGQSLFVVDLPGHGGFTLAEGAPSLDLIGGQVAALMEALGPARFDVVGHDHGALVALWLGLNHPRLLASVSLAASPLAAPTGDSVGNLTLAGLPWPRASALSQAWALERISYSHHHIDRALLESCVTAADSQVYRHAAAIMGEDGYERSYLPSVRATKSRLYELCRGEGFPVPAQVIWAANDPLTPPERGFALYEVLAAGQPATRFTLVNRAGHLLFREQPEAFYRALMAFHEALA
ncbi:MAG TPA: alpha/beta fold hydrolase [Candidatus Binataceae bacterium]|nr:alpha/beta fold hydrolase [Candidatus Binataceae bacterium]